MKNAKRPIQLTGVFAICILVFGSCQKFSTLNTNPNNLTPSAAAPDYLMAQVLSSTATWYGGWGNGNMSGAMQQTAEDAWGSQFSEYEWGQTDWSPNYFTLENNKLMLSAAQTNGWKFHQGVGLVMRAFNYGNIADFWGDAPDSLALNGDQGSLASQQPAFDSQEQIYKRVIADLQAALPLLQGTMVDHPEITPNTQNSDVFYGGDPVQWRKLAYSLMLRYYMRLSSKWSVQSQVEAIAGNVFASTSDDCAMAFPGTDNPSSYQFNSSYQLLTMFNRNKMSATLVSKLNALKDPRIVVMAQPISTPSVVDATQFAPGDNTTLVLLQNGVRYINPAAAAALNYKQFNPATYAADRPYGAVQASLTNLYDTASTYVGIPISYSQALDFQYNINGAGTQSNSNNNYVSYLRQDIYNKPSGPLLAERIASYSEICFDLAEAALKGWNVGQSAATWYNRGIQASFDTWTVFSNYQSDVNAYFGCVKDYASYIAQPAVAFNGTLQQIIEQKWIAGWQACNEPYMDWRRTGYPALNVGWASYRGALPLRFSYANAEMQNNPTNSAAAIAGLQTTSFVGTDGNNSCWSKFWLLQGTTVPY
jgi:hypothetical protein